jgi:hypothetical protein
MRASRGCYRAVRARSAISARTGLVAGISRSGSPLVPSSWRTPGRGSRLGRLAGLAPDQQPSSPVTLGLREGLFSDGRWPDARGCARPSRPSEGSDTCLSLAKMPRRAAQRRGTSSSGGGAPRQRSARSWPLTERGDSRFVGESGQGAEISSPKPLDGAAILRHMSSGAEPGTADDALRRASTRPILATPGGT